MCRRQFLLVVCILAALPAFQGPGARANDNPSPAELRAEVERRQQELAHTEAALAEARGRLALAEGRKQEAAEEFRKVAAYRDAQLKALLAHPERICNPHTVVEAQGELAVARVRVAEAEGTSHLAALLPGVVDYYRGRIKSVERLLRSRAIRPEEAREDLRRLNKQLQGASGRLEEVRGRLEREKGAKSKN